MTDIDLIANLDPATGLPLVDTRSAARRWLEALHYGPTFPEQHKNNQRIPAGRCRKQQQPHAPDQRAEQQHTDENENKV